ncbi:hypothetical protein Srufu_073320 [Streptomyces libani subsp. rufus]|nr:hypothetical protein Srufu_073320 [Streptomyces libani subsp. rufus]
MAGPVVVGLDGTGNSVPAVLWGAEEAAARGLALHLLHSSGSPSADVPPADPEAAGRERRGPSCSVAPWTWRTPGTRGSR